MYKQIFDPVGGSLGLSAIFAVLPLLAIFVLLGAFKVKAQWAGLAALVVALLVAVLVYGMPVGQALLAASEGAAFGIFPIMWIVINAIWIYNMTVVTGHFDVLRRSFGSISRDQRIQAIIIAFCFGALLEALAGFGTPVAISSVMLIALGFAPVKAAAVSLVANTAPVAFGAIAVPITTLGKITGLPAGALGAHVGRQTPVLALFVPLALVLMVDGRRGLRQTWPAAVVGGVTFALAQFLCSNYFSIELTDIVASLVAVAALVALLRVWQPAEILEGEALTEADIRARIDAATATAHRVETAGGGRSAAGNPSTVAVGTRASGVGEDASVGAGVGAERAERPLPPPGLGLERDPAGEVARAYGPYGLIVLVFALAQVPAIKSLLAKGAVSFLWPGISILARSGKPPSAVTYAFGWLSAGGTLLLISGLLTMLVLKVSPGRAVRAYLATLDQLKWAILTVAAVLALAYVMNLSGQTVTIGLWLAGAGGLFALLSPILGWLGVAVTGSDTSSNALFGTLQVTAARNAGLDPILLAAGNSSGGVLGKMISPQNLAIASAAVGMAGGEGELFRKVIGWSVGFLVFMCLLVYLQSTPVLSWMLAGL